ncbi:glycosyltransferase, group 2 family [Treponema primitia ZAS-2]|uniref:Glycosyltransferase, group 2 family n=1 Tax=Treponema primitia (strain ATCC BAA-887 / DSM 12427 / ZAS-2) TaxID=545694 RepID=F5YHI8_TREPZ|nr:glycosyltransferase family 2 protein [Treponema primitia]AEF86394.1 glycosyltransferase, group 2 family [Treponema primitia ZAS-2]
MIKFSIIIPVYNTAKYLHRCINSCINQTYNNIEIICIDDYSNDNSKEILKQFQKNDTRIKCFFHSKNKSQFIARRTGIENSIGDYILFLDSDDYLNLNACALLKNEIQKTSPDIIQFDSLEVPSNKKRFLPFYNTSKACLEAYLDKENRCSPIVWIKAYARSVIIEAYKSMDDFYASGSEDLYTSIVISFYAKTFGYLKKPLINYSVTTGWTRKREYSLEIYKQWLTSYHTVIVKINEFIAKNIPELKDKCLGMELYLLKDFLFNRIPSDIPKELKFQFFDILPSYFSKEVIYDYFEETIQKSNKYNTYLDFNGSFKSKTKKILKVVLLYIKSLFKLDTIHDRACNKISVNGYTT